MNRRLSSGVGIGLAMIGIFSCSDNSVSGTDGLSADDLSADANRVASVAVSLASSTIAVGDTTRATAVLRDYSNRLIYRTVLWTSSDSTVAKVSSSGLVTGIGTGTAVITASRGYKSGSATITVAAAITAAGSASVASLRVSLGSSALVTGQTTQAAATTYDSAGNVLAGRAITWSSGNALVATVSGSGLVTAVAAGTVSITAASEGKSASASLTVSAPIITSTGTGPEPATGDVILLQDGFNKATIQEQLASWANAGTFSRVTDGHNGEAVRVSYNSSTWNTNTFARNLSALATDAYYRYWFRTSPGADPTCGGRNWSGFKWFMTHRPDGYPRYTHGVSMISGGPAGYLNTGMEFSTHDNSSTGQPNPFMENVNKSIRFNTTNDGKWHEYTLHVVTGNGGYEQIWIDGVKVLDSQSYAYDHSPVGIESIALPGTMVQWYSGCEFTVDIDDIVVWHK